jgi:autotransporter-associated beta strand protein
MKKILVPRLLFALLMAAASPAAMAGTATFFTDTFSNGSTLTNHTPAAPTIDSTSYQLIGAKAWIPNASTLAPGDLKVAMVATTGGQMQIQALFTNSPVTLTAIGDFLQMTVTFTNTGNLLVASSSSQLAFGLYNSGQVQPVAGGLYGFETSSVTTNTTGGAAGWAGYVGQILASGGNSRIMTRPAQTGPDNRNQDLITSGSSSFSYANPAPTTVGSTVVSAASLVNGQTYTENLNITVNGQASYAITNTLYSGPNTNGTVVTQFGGVATNTTFLASGFDGLAIGWYCKASSSTATTNDISSIQIIGHSTAVNAPPDITSQPVSVTVANGGTCAMWVNTIGFGQIYQWYRHGTNIVSGGNISIVNSSDLTTSTLIISPAGPGDVESGANDYYCTITGTGGYQTNSALVSLSVVPATNLVWSGSGTVWDVATSPNWVDTNGNTTVFTYGDPVLFDDTGAANRSVTLTGSYLSAASFTVNSSLNYTFTGSGSFAGPGTLIYQACPFLSINNANTHTGGTIISNTSTPLYLYLQNYAGLGNGTVTLDNAGGTMEVAPTGNASTGINGPINVADDFTIQFDGLGTYAGVLFGDLSGTVGKTLTLLPNQGGSTTNNRVRLYGTNTTYNANLVLNGQYLILAPYGSQTFNGVISGNGALMEKGTVTYLNANNTYSGGTMPSGGAIGFGIDSTGSPTVTAGPIGTGPLLLTVDSTTGTTGNGQVFASGGPHTIWNPIQNPTGTNNLTLIVGGTNDLTFPGAFTLNGNDNVTAASITARTVQVTNTGLTTISGVVSDNGLGYGFIKTGSGILALTATETYTGPTLVSNGTLWVNGQLNVASAVTVATNGILGGTGNVNGPVTVQPGGTLAPGAASIGSLNINNSLALAGDVQVRVNRSGFASDEAIVSGALNNTGTGTVVVTNTGAALHVGDTFTLFNNPVTGGAGFRVVGAGVGWNNQLGASGQIVVASTNLPTITSTFSGSTLTLSWPTAYLGWQVQSNSVSLTSTNWFIVPNSGGSANLVITPSLARSNVFYRLVQP